MEQFNPPPLEPEEWTCGKGIAANAPLPAALAQVIAAQARVLELHMRALDPADPQARIEYNTYQTLVTQQQHIAQQLTATAQAMTAAHDLPIVPHDEQAMMHRDNLIAFETLVTAKQQLLALLQSTADEDRAMLSQMREVMS